jgi:hypothetical protein
MLEAHSVLELGLAMDSTTELGWVPEMVRPKGLALVAHLVLVGDSVTELVSGGTMASMLVLVRDSVTELVSGMTMASRLVLVRDSVAELLSGGTMASMLVLARAPKSGSESARR